MEHVLESLVKESLTLMPFGLRLKWFFSKLQWYSRQCEQQDSTVWELVANYCLDIADYDTDRSTLLVNQMVGCARCRVAELRARYRKLIMI